MTLPIDAVLDTLRDHLRRGPNLVLQAPPGAGKTTRVPLALLAEPWLAGRSILLLEPRRLAARAAATRMAEQLHEPVGATVGYRIRLEQRISRQTRIEVLTEGILTRRLQSDPLLDGVGLVIFDEFHERGLHADLGLALCLECQSGVRPDLRLLVMSATLDGEAVARLMGDAPVITARGRQYPVETRYLARDPDGDPATIVARTVERALAEQSGDVLVFLPGGAEIRRARTLLTASPVDATILPLYGDLPAADQQRALQPEPCGRRVVLASAIAETSLTIEGVRTVIDSGWARVPRFDPNTGLTRLITERVSRASAEQRAGRAGRLGPGTCYRLWSEPTQQRLAPESTPEILTTDLTRLSLELALWGSSAERLRWLDQPPAAALAQARELLRDLGALDSRDRITATGRELAEWPLHPRLAHMLLRGAELGLGAPACDLAALLEERDPLRGGDRPVDLEQRLAELQRWRTGHSNSDPDRLPYQRIGRIAAQLRGRLPPATANPPPTAHPIGLLLAFAYTDRIARRRPGTEERYQLANGRGARLPVGDPLTGRDWLVVARLEAAGAEGRIQLAATLDESTLRTHCSERLTWHERIDWNEREQAVLAQQEQRLGALVLSCLTLDRADPERHRAALLGGIRRMGLDCLPWTDELRQWRARVATLHHWCADEGWPDAADTALLADLGGWLAPWLDGIGRREHLARLDLAAILRQWLGWSLSERLDAAAPTHLRVPSGSRVRLRYDHEGDPPVLAVKLQELFGLGATPRLNRGRIPLVLHLLSPARRPIQITRDLHGFWEKTYPEVRKELKGRYPKHPWPEDPWSAVPTRGTKAQSG